MLVKKFREFILSEDQTFKVVDSYTKVKLSVPDDLARWAMLYYCMQHDGKIISADKIPADIIKASKKLALEYGDGRLFRGIHIKTNALPETIHSGRKTLGAMLKTVNQLHYRLTAFFFSFFNILNSFLIGYQVQLSTRFFTFIVVFI